MKFREKIARFLYGRYGADSLYNALFVGELILLFVATVLNILGKIEQIAAEHPAPKEEPDAEPAASGK